MARSALGSTALFAGVPDAVLEELGDELTVVGVPGGQMLFSRGDAGDSLYLVVTGRLQVLGGDQGSDRHRDVGILTELGPGDVVGEIAMLTDEPRSATVRAVRDTVLLQLTRAGFDDFTDRHPESLLPLARGLARRLAKATHAEMRTRPPRTVALVAAGDSSVTSLVAEALAVALGRFGRVAVISSGVVDGHLGPGAADREITDGSDAVGSWLHDREGDHDFLLYQGDTGSSAWTGRCVRQADRVLLVADARASPVTSPAERALLPRGRTGPRVDLVLVHSEHGPRPTSTATWLEPRSLHAHHHFRAGRAADVDRLARVLAGRAVGLVLGGGGPRGFAHLGVMRALEEAGVPIDVVGGSSIGAVMGASYAMGLDHQTREAAAIAAFVESRFLFGPTLPMVSLSSSRKVTRLLRSPLYFGELRIEDLWTPFFCVSSNLSTAEVVVHDGGAVWRAVRSSISLPGILPPVCTDGDVLVDGGVMNNLPADVMQGRIDGGRIVAVDLQADVEFRTVEAFEPTLSGWTALQWRLPPSPRADAVPGIVATLLRTMEVGWARARAALLESGVCDVVLRPPLGTTRLVDFSVGPALIETAYRYTLDRLDDETLAALRP